MTRDDVFDVIQRLRAEGRPFAVATVLRTEDATSARPGDKAVIDETGAIHGHLGGGCVRRAAQAAAETVRHGGAPRIVRVRPTAQVVALTDADGAAVYRSGCPSGGTVELLIEPFVPAPRLVVYGAGAVARAVAEIGAVMRLRVMRQDRAGGGDDRASGALAPRDCIVVATQGQGDGEALRAALDSDAGLIALVASRNKTENLLRRAAENGACRDRLAAVRAPAGLAIGAVEPEEIALSICAEIVAERRRARVEPTPRSLQSGEG